MDENGKRWNILLKNVCATIEILFHLFLKILIHIQQSILGFQLAVSSPLYQSFQGLHLTKII